MSHASRRAFLGGLLLLCAVSLAHAAPDGTSAARPQLGPLLVGTTVAEPPAYASITSLDEGPLAWVSHDDDAEVRARAQRVVIATETIYSRVFLETVTYGAEGCCKQLARVVEFDLRAFADTLALPGDMIGFQFVQWLSDTSFIFQFKDREFVMSRIDRDEVLVTPYQGQ